MILPLIRWQLFEDKESVIEKKKDLIHVNITVREWKEIGTGQPA